MLLLVGGAGCSYFHTMYFERMDRGEVRIDRFRLTPRIFAYQDLKCPGDTPEDRDFVVSIRVEDIRSHTINYTWQAEQVTIDSLADDFLREVSSVFIVDSLVFHQTPHADERILMFPDQANFSPRREDFFTLQFGYADIPLETTRLRVVLHVSRLGPSNPRPSPDSAVWLMNRVEIHDRGLNMFRDNMRGYE